MTFTRNQQKTRPRWLSLTKLQRVAELLYLTHPKQYADLRSDPTYDASDWEHELHMYARDASHSDVDNDIIRAVESIMGETPTAYCLVNIEAHIKELGETPWLNRKR